MEDELLECQDNGTEEIIWDSGAYRNIRDLRYSIILQTSSIYRSLLWNAGNCSQQIQDYFEDTFKNTINMQKEKKMPQDDSIEILTPEKAINIALLLAGATKSQPKGMIFKVVNDMTAKRIKGIIQVYSNEFDQWVKQEFGISGDEAENMSKELKRVHHHIKNRRSRK